MERTELEAEPSIGGECRTGRDVTVGIVNYNGATYLPDTLGAVGRLGSRVSEVLLVDNASADGSVTLARQLYPDLRVVVLDSNRGPGAARNEILRRASCERILMIDNDVAPEVGCPERLSAALDENSGAVIAMPAVLFADAPHTVQYVGADAHFLGTMTLREAGRPAATLGSRVRSVTSLVTACLMVDRRRFPGTMFFDEAFFFHFEDHEMGLRCRLMGLDLLAVEGARCLHGAGTLGVSLRSSGEFTAVRVRNTIRNRWQLILKLYQGRTLLLLAPALAVFEVFQLLGAVRKGWLGHWLRAAAWMSINLPDVLHRRRDFARERRRPDLAVLEGGPFPFNPATPTGWLERAAGRGLDWVVQLNWRLVGRR